MRQRGLCACAWRERDRDSENKNSRAGKADPAEALRASGVVQRIVARALNHVGGRITDLNQVASLLTPDALRLIVCPAAAAPTSSTAQVRISGYLSLFLLSVNRVCGLRRRQRGS